VHLAVVESVALELVPAVEHLRAAFARKARQFRSVVKSGRTHLMDATPVTLGQEMGGYAAQLGAAVERLDHMLPRVGQLPLGGTAVGTGINAPRTFAPKVVALLVERTGLSLSEAPDHFAAQGARDGLVEASGELRGLAVALTKIANDLRWMASGPRTGLAEIRLPDLQPGSSIMPGKVNPVLCEAVTQVAAQVIGNDAAVAFGGTQGNFELNVYVPMMARNVLESIGLLANVCRLFADRCVDGIEVDEERCRAFAESSPSLGTSLNPFLGYEKAAELVKASVRTGRSIRDLVLDEGLMDADDLDRALDVLGMTKGGVRR
jgi:fumarate hydratase, class II